MLQPRPDTDRLPKPNRTPTAEANNTVRAALLGVFQSFVCYVGGRMHRRLAEQACGRDRGIFEDGFECPNLFFLLWCREE